MRKNGLVPVRSASPTVGTKTPEITVRALPYGQPAEQNLATASTSLRTAQPRLTVAVGTNPPWGRSNFYRTASEYSVHLNHYRAEAQHSKLRIDPLSGE